MKPFRKIHLALFSQLILFGFAFGQNAQAGTAHDKTAGQITLSDGAGNLRIRIDCATGCWIDSLAVRGNETVGAGDSVYTGYRMGGRLFTSRHAAGAPAIRIRNNRVSIGGIRYGDPGFTVEEEWTFETHPDDIRWRIDRRYLNGGTLDENYFPCWSFHSMQTWDGALLDTGGVAWCRFLDAPDATYGAHAGGLTFWNKAQNACLRVTPTHNAGSFMAAAFSRGENNAFIAAQTVAPHEIEMKHELRRFLEKSRDVFAPIKIEESEISVAYKLESPAYDQAYDRGAFAGLNEASVNEILNTIARYAVVDKNLYGSNGWRTGWAVLQEPWLALFGLAIDSPDFIAGYSRALEYEKEHAVLPDGRVLPRWHHDSSDAMPGTYRPDGFYECRWGYMLDSQPAFAIDVAEQFDMTGDLEWLRKFKSTCEKALDYMIRRDTDGNGLFEVIQNSHTEEKGTDWLDVIWASYEPASVNALMYHALARWTDLEELLGDGARAEQFKRLAARLKTTFNKEIAEGGFWNPDKKWYVHWREKDGSVYGDNLGSVINFLAIGYGICDQLDRREAVLNKMEERMQKENLFIWPACFFPYEENVGHPAVNYPFPNYENGDLFLGWAELGTRCYVERDPAIAVKYIRKVIDRYERDGLAHQRYTRAAQTGAGDDILANNAMAIVGLYRNIYGIRPQYNRLYLEPHLVPELYGTRVKYGLRNQIYTIGLAKEGCSVAAGHFSLSCGKPFGVRPEGDRLFFFDGNNARHSLKITCRKTCSVDIVDWKDGLMSWRETATSGKTNIAHELQGLAAAARYSLRINGATGRSVLSDAGGVIRFDGSVDEKGSGFQLTCE